MSDEGKSLKESIIEAQEMQEKIKALKKEKHDFKYELYQLRQRVDKLEQENMECRKCLATMNATIIMQFQLINALCDLSKGMAEDIVKMSAMMVKEADNDI